MTEYGVDIRNWSILHGLNEKSKKRKFVTGLPESGGKGTLSMTIGTSNSITWEELIAMATTGIEECNGR